MAAAWLHSVAGDTGYLDGWRLTLQY